MDRNERAPLTVETAAIERRERRIRQARRCAAIALTAAPDIASELIDEAVALRAAAMAAR